MTACGSYPLDKNCKCTIGEKYYVPANAFKPGRPGVPVYVCCSDTTTGYCSVGQKMAIPILPPPLIPLVPPEEEQPLTPLVPPEEEQPLTPLVPPEEEQPLTPLVPPEEEQPLTPLVPPEEEQPLTPLVPPEEEQPLTPLRPDTRTLVLLITGSVVILVLLILIIVFGIIL